MGRIVIGLLLLFCSLSRPSSCGAEGSGNVWDPQSKLRNVFDGERLKLTAEYSRIHYGTETSELRDPRMIVLHYTAFATFSDSLRFFLPPVLDTRERADISSGGRVNVSAHYLVDRDGTLYQLAPENVICRHIIGFNYTAIGIENVGKNKHALTEAQAETDAALVSRIVKRHPGIEYLIGHQEYQDGSLPHFALFLEKDPAYRFTPKHDPGCWFLERVRTLLKEKYGIVLKD